MVPVRPPFVGQFGVGAVEFFPDDVIDAVNDAVVVKVAVDAGHGDDKVYRAAGID
jgi:hypothetical protein